MSPFSSIEHSIDMAEQCLAGCPVDQQHRQRIAAIRASIAHARTSHGAAREQALGEAHALAVELAEALARQAQPRPH